MCVSDNATDIGYEMYHVPAIYNDMVLFLLEVCNMFGNTAVVVQGPSPTFDSRDITPQPRLPTSECFSRHVTLTTRNIDNPFTALRIWMLP